MVYEESQFDIDDVICQECIEDRGLRECLRSEGSEATCSLCGNENISVTIVELAAIIDPVLRQHFMHGEFVRRYGPGDDDRYWEEQQGIDLSSVLQELLGQLLDCQDALIDALIDADPSDPRDGEDPFYDETVFYEEIPVYVGHLYDEWNAISQELRTERRFFSDRAREFFDWLFDGVEELRFYQREVVDFSDDAERAQPKEFGVIHEWRQGESVFRGRRVDTTDSYATLLLNPKRELAPPPSVHARAGRMNPQGVPIFYGALDEPTCLAEMRSSIGSYIVTACFQTCKPLRILDFARLDKATWDGKELSFFQTDFEEQVARRKFRRRLHRLISQPVAIGDESEYLITQVLAEYLAHVRSQTFDGLLFASAQRDGGTNVVLFPKHSRQESEMLARFALKYVANSVGLYQAERIRYDMRKRRFFIDGDQVRLHSDYEDHYDQD
jgi:hypothetical protein